MRESFKIQSAGPETAGTIARIHHDAVDRGEARKFYNQEVLDDWSPPVTKQRIDDLKKKMTASHATWLIGTLESEPVGYGVLDLNNERIGAIYVKAAFAGLHVGARLLRKLEKIALQKGHAQLQLDSSLNAKSFYQKHGYTQIAEDAHELPTGRRMASVRMSKTLPRRSSGCDKNGVKLSKG
jgi:ribosomal protein S18 acetylase RimI-like enzyme